MGMIKKVLAIFLLGSANLIGMKLKTKVHKISNGKLLEMVVFKIENSLYQMPFYLIKHSQTIKNLRKGASDTLENPQLAC